MEVYKCRHILTSSFHPRWEDFRPGISIPPVFCFCVSVSLLSPSGPGLSWLVSIGSLSTGRHCTLGERGPRTGELKHIISTLYAIPRVKVTHCIHNIYVQLSRRQFSQQNFSHFCGMDGYFILTCLPTVHCCSMVHSVDSGPEQGSQCPPVREIWHKSSGRGRKNKVRKISVTEKISVFLLSCDPSFSSGRESSAAKAIHVM